MINEDNHRYNIDLLKVIALVCIIIAHIPNASKNVLQLRNFDVVLMVILSGYLSNLTFKPIEIKNKILLSLKRLIIPSYIFIIFYLIIIFLY